MNERQRLEQIVQRQRSVIAFAQAAWSQAHEGNTQLQQIIVALQARLEAHRIFSETTPIDSINQLSFTFDIKTNGGHIS